MSREDVKISVIVPVYKAEPYLHKCVDSILAQTHKNLEVILVDDGSPDCCPSICDEYAAKDSRVRVIHKENGGVSSARNAGLDVATGDYIGFVDSDDWIAPEMYEKLLDTLQNQDAAAAVCGYIECDEKGTMSREIKPYRTGRISGLEAARNILYSTASRNGAFDGPYEIYVVCWNKIYRREVFKLTRFDQTLTNGEDALVEFQIFSGIQRVAVVNKSLYFYRQRNGSATHGEFALVIQGRYHMAEKMLQISKPELRRACIHNLVVFVFARINSLAISGNRDAYTQFRKEYQKWNRIIQSEYHNLTRKYQVGLLLFWAVPDIFWSISRKRTQK